jgi:hypothetical protein
MLAIDSLLLFFNSVGNGSVIADPRVNSLEAGLGVFHRRIFTFPVWFRILPINLFKAC